MKMHQTKFITSVIGKETTEKLKYDIPLRIGQKDVAGLCC
jgi:hypothetical protein